MTNLPLLEEKISGNIIPHSWYKIFKTCNKPDLIAITILAEVLFKYRTGQVVKGKWRVNYGYFENKFDFSKNQIRAALTRLEAYKVVTREITTESHNDRKYGGVLYLIYNHEALQLIQKNFTCHEKKLTPPCEKPHPNKSSNEIILNIKDLEKINESNGPKYSLEYCKQILLNIQDRYPNLIFSTKHSLINYLKKTLRSYNKISSSNFSSISNLCQNEDSLDLERHLSHFENYSEQNDKPGYEAIFEFNQSMNAAIKNSLPKELLVKIENSFLLTKAKNDGDFVVQILCAKSFVLPYENPLLEIAKGILNSPNVVFQYLKFDQLNSVKLFAILKLKLYFTHGLRMYSSWFKHLDFGYFKGSEWVFCVNNKFIRDWIEDHYREEILSCINSFRKGENGLQIQVQNFNKL
jgi:hypothetical protein